MAENEPIFNFMYVRPAEALAATTEQRGYIRDLDEPPPRRVVSMLPRDTSLVATSPVAKIVCEAVFGQPVDIPEGIAQLKRDLLGLLVEVIPVADIDKPPQIENNAVPIPATVLERFSYIVHEGRFFLLPDRLGKLDVPLQPLLQALIKNLTTNPLPAQKDLVDKLQELADNRALSDVVFGDNGHSAEFIAAARGLFDTLYLLYMLRRWTSIDLEPIMDALRALHVLEALAVDQLITRKIDGTIDPAGEAKLVSSSVYFPQLAGWDGKAVAGVVPLLADQNALQVYWSATPVIHPIFAKLFHYRRPFNDIKPIGVGDLKVVKQKLLKYEAGEISHIHNILKGESNLREHRRLEKTEESFSFSSSTEQESQRDSQSTDRSEIKREAEDVIKTEMGGNAGTSVTYNQGMVIATVSAGFAASRSGTSTEKSANNFSKEVVSKALDRVVKRSAEARSTNKTFETEERNRHEFSNLAGDAHVAGIYRWVDKRYQAQVYNFGKRMMFEFIVPEPAAFLVEQRLRGFEAAMQVPLKPKREPDDRLDMGFAASDITEGKFRELKSEYDLGDFTYPPKEIKAQVLDPENGETLVRRTNLNSDNAWWAVTCKLNVANVDGYDIDWIGVTGNIEYADRGGAGADSNLVAVRVDGQLIWDNESSLIYTSFGTDFGVDLNEWSIRGTSANPKIQLSLQDARRFELLVTVRLIRSAAALATWQEAVFEAVKRVEMNKLKAINKEKERAFQSAMTTFNNRLDELRAVAVNDLLQGKSEAYNRRIMMIELKRACLSLLTKEFDADESDDILTDWNTMGEFDVTSHVTRMQVDRGAPESEATAEFTTTDMDHRFPAIDIAEARRKAPHIQFLEQAFDWQQIGWVCYPYFWADTPKWVSMISREDATDPALTQFLQAGAAKVLIAVSPEYDQAVLHYLATREPWEGGAAPALGDPLYLPLYEEMHKAQDDIYGGTAVGEPWEFTVPTSLVYLSGAKDKLPDFTQP